MHNPHIIKRPASGGLVCDIFKFAFGHPRIVIKGQSRNLITAMNITHQSNETDRRPDIGTAIGEGGQSDARIKNRFPERIRVPCGTLSYAALSRDA